MGWDEARWVGLLCWCGVWFPIDEFVGRKTHGIEWYLSVGSEGVGLDRQLVGVGLGLASKRMSWLERSDEEPACLNRALSSHAVPLEPCCSYHNATDVVNGGSAHDRAWVGRTKSFLRQCIDALLAVDGH